MKIYYVECVYDRDNTCGYGVLLNNAHSNDEYTMYVYISGSQNVLFREILRLGESNLGADQGRIYEEAI
jgi:hypothetical protein